MKPSKIQIFISFLTTLFLTPIFMFLICLTFLFSILKKGPGLSESYLNVLLTMFEYGTKISIEKARTGALKAKKIEKESDEVQTPELAPESRQFCTEGFIILRDKNSILVPQSPDESGDRLETNSGNYTFDAIFDYTVSGMEAIIEDQVTSRFEAEELINWNFLTRTNRGACEFISWKLTVMWAFGFIGRYFFMLPLKIFMFISGLWFLTMGSALVGYIESQSLKRRLNLLISIVSFRILSKAIGLIVTYHDEENMPKSGICVANHTSPIDAGILMCQNCYSLTGQKHVGFLGFIQRALSRASTHIWFDRSEMKDRQATAQKMKDHVSNPTNPPILIFPEGACINNTSVMQFRKGSFEVDTVIYPVAIKYDARFGDAFWSDTTMLKHLYLMMTSWAIVCEVWYLPAMKRQEGESATVFAKKIQSLIAKTAGLTDLVWDGQLLKLSKPKKEWVEHQQRRFYRKLRLD